MTNKQFNSSFLAARYFGEFMKDPHVENNERNIARELARKAMGDEDYYMMLNSEIGKTLKNRQFDFRLDMEEVDRYKKDGFVVSKRLTAASFTDAYYQVFTDDLPVFVSADSIFHAWGRSFANLLQEIEEECVRPSLLGILKGMLQAISKLNPDKVVEEVDFYLSVAVSLLCGSQHGGSFCGDQRVRKTLREIQTRQTSTAVIFDEKLGLDFSSFEPCGHYTYTEDLTNYYRAISWLTKIEIRLFEGGRLCSQSFKFCELLLRILQLSGQAKKLQKLDTMIMHFVEGTGSVDLLSLRDISCHSNEMRKTNIPGKQDISLLSQTNDCGVNRCSGVFGEAEIQISFCFFKEMLTLEAFSVPAETLDNIEMDEVSCLRRRSLILTSIVTESSRPTTRISDDTCFSEARNLKDECSKHLPSRPARRGRTTLTTSIYSMWLDVFRSLSLFPSQLCSTFTSDAWKNRVTKMLLDFGSNLLHSSEAPRDRPYGCMSRCGYPESIIEPNPLFFDHMMKMSKELADILNCCELYCGPGSHSKNPWRLTMKEKHVKFLSHFSDTMLQLRDICQAQCAKNLLSEEQKVFLGNMLEEPFRSSTSMYMGWYPRLYYEGEELTGLFKPRHADIFTSPNDPQGDNTNRNLYIGDWNVHQMLVAVNDTCYAGPVFLDKPADMKLTNPQIPPKKVNLGLFLEHVPAVERLLTT